MPSKNLTSEIDSSYKCLLLLANFHLGCLFLTLLLSELQWKCQSVETLNDVRLTYFLEKCYSYIKYIIEL